MKLDKWRRIRATVGELDLQVQSHLPVWMDQAKFIRPYHAEFYCSDWNDGSRQDEEIIDCSGGLSLRTFEAGMTSGITSPARPWISLTTSDPSLAAYAPVKEYLFTVTKIILDTFQKSNVYGILPSLYGDYGTWANAAMSVEEDFETVIRCQRFPVGSWRIANDSRGRVRTFHRRFRWTVKQLVERFGTYDPVTGRARWEVFSSRVKNLWDNSNYLQMIDVEQLIEPNMEFDLRKSAASKFKKFASTYWETGGNEQKFLEEKGFDYFPVLVPRWSVKGTDPYGLDSPGRLCLGDIKQLQFGELQALKLVEENANPSMKGPTSLEGKYSTNLPGGLTFVDESQSGTKYSPTREVNPRLQESEMKQEAVRNRVSRAYYEDLMLRISMDERNQRATAQEIVAGKEERFLVLGAVLPQLNADLLDPMVEITYALLNRQRRLPPPPKELEGQAIKVEYISIFAQAQKAVGISSHERFLQTTGVVIGMNEESRDKIDFDQYIDESADMLGVSPKIVRSDDAVAEIRAQRAKAQQQQAQIEAIRQGAGAAKDLSQANLEGNNALSALMGGGNQPTQ